MNGCPEGMYPMDSDYETNVCEDFAELRQQAESMSDSLNFPISWYFSGHGINEDSDEDEKPKFQLVFLMPRKYGKTWSLSTSRFDQAEVQEWIDTWLRDQVNTWYGWDE